MEISLLTESKNFFDSKRKEIVRNIASEESVVFVDLNELQRYSPKLIEYLDKDAEAFVSVLESSLEELEWAPNDTRVRFTNAPNSKKISMKNIRAKHLRKMIEIEGIIKETSNVEIITVSSKFECRKCGTIIPVLQIEKTYKEPARCECGNTKRFKEISKDFVDSQSLLIEEICNDSNDNLPKKVMAFLKEDLVTPERVVKNITKTKVRIIGILNEIPRHYTNGVQLTGFNVGIEVNNIELV
jgi:replicative DNA helicase Mcm